jgi:hypothetical protein
MKKLLSGVLSIIFLSSLLSSCNKEDSADVNQETIYTVYELFYNANTGKTVAIARLHFGSPTGTLLEAVSPAGVTFNGDQLPYSVLYSGHAKEYVGKITTGTFVYTNTTSNTYTNSPPFMDSLSHPTAFDTIFKSQANLYAWNGSTLSSTERANLFVGSWTWGQDALFFATSGQNDIVMGINQLANLAVGTSTLYVDRVNEVGLSQATPEGGVIRTRYRPLNATVQVAP